jgi:hypothetical protein
VVKGRLEKAFAESPYILDGVACEAEVVVSITSFDSARIPDVQAYIAHVKDMHRLAMAAAVAGAGDTGQARMRDLIRGPGDPAGLQPSP